MPLGLALVGRLIKRRRVAPLFFLMTGAALMIGLAEQSTIIKYPLLLWELPRIIGRLRAPGRYAYIVFRGEGRAAVRRDRLPRWSEDRGRRKLVA